MTQTLPMAGAADVVERHFSAEVGDDAGAVSAVSRESW